MTWHSCYAGEGRKLVNVFLFVYIGIYLARSDPQILLDRVLANPWDPQPAAISMHGGHLAVMGLASVAACDCVLEQRRCPLMHDVPADSLRLVHVWQTTRLSHCEDQPGTDQGRSVVGSGHGLGSK